MKEDIPWQLLENKFKENISSEDDIQLHEWVLNSSENQLIYCQLKSHFQKNCSMPLHFTPDPSLAFNKFLDTTRLIKGKGRNISILFKIAAVLIVCFISYWIVQKQSKTEVQEYVVVSAGDSANLQVSLPDGSSLCLNAKSKIRYAKNFKASRYVYLIGEAYFEVAHNTKHPFRVYADKSITTVVGTKFNIRSWLHEKEIKITVNEGKVNFGPENGKRVPLLKGQTGILEKSSQNVSLFTSADYNYLSWKTKDFYFENLPLKEVLQKLSYAYNIEFIKRDSSLMDYRLTAKFHQRPLSEIIQTLEVVTGVKMEKSGNNYVIK